MNLSARTLCYVLALAGVGACLRSPLRPGIVVGSSMSPTFESGKLYLMDTAHYCEHPVERGDVVVFRRDGKTYLKRVIGLPGDTLYSVKSAEMADDELLGSWQLSRARRLFGRGAPAARASGWRWSLKLVERRVPPGTCYVVGDNLQGSMDSRHFGPIQIEAIQGRVRNAPPPSREVASVAVLPGPAGGAALREMPRRHRAGSL